LSWTDFARRVNQTKGWFTLWQLSL